MTDLGGTAKPLDFGTGRVCASFDAGSAAWLALGSAHHGQGFVELSDMPPFDERRRGDPVATRRHREAMAEAAHAFLTVEIGGEPASLEADASDPPVPRWTGEGIDVSIGGRADDDAIVQVWRVERSSNQARRVSVRLRGGIDRPALAEITELDPPSPTGATTVMGRIGEGVRLTAPLLGAEATLRIEGADADWQVEGGEAAALLAWPYDRAELRFTLTVRLNAGLGPSERPAVSEGDDHDDLLIDRALAYIRGCTALHVAPDERVILTDHRILPLSWTRDAYWQALALLATSAPGDRRRVADHLRWLWRRCERPDGLWMRSHHADGRRKDLAFQADQQLYPLLELADYWRKTHALPEGVAWDAEVARAWAGAEAHVDGALGLIGSAENAADDPSAAPYIASSQILAWYAAERIAELAEAGALTLDAAPFRATGQVVADAFERHFVAGDAPWPYAVDDDGTRVTYHDANDLPGALAPLLGFCAADDPGWRATMRFAFGPDNPGWSTGERPGLGSAHTPGPWTLGDLQALIVGRATGDLHAERAALARLRDVAYADGMLPEAYAANGERRIRTWFAWPGAALTALQILDRSGRLEALLAARAR